MSKYYSLINITIYYNLIYFWKKEDKNKKILFIDYLNHFNKIFLF